MPQFKAGKDLRYLLRRSIKSKLNFDKTYLITSYHSKDRLSETLPHLKENGIDPEIFVAPFKYHFPQFHYFNDNTENCVWPGKISLACAYEQLFQKCIIDNTQTALFIEDDVVLLPGWKEKINTEWNIKDWYILKTGSETHFFAMSLQAMKDYLNKFAMSYNSIDFQINLLKPTIVSDNIATQKSWSDEDYKVPSTIDVKSDAYTLEF